MKQKFYRLDRIIKLNANYNILLGERSNGKSYATKEYCIKQAYNNPDTDRFILLRRWDLETKQSLVEQYFNDAPISAITDGNCDGVVVYRGEIWLSKYNEETTKNERKIKIGYSRALSMEQHYSSGSYNDVQNILYEEFISRDYYLPTEPIKLMHFVSTVARRRKISVFMIGNTISRLCPYFEEWQLVNTVKQKQGTIETYTYNTDQQDEDGNTVNILIAVEFCENSGRNSKMFFGSATNMITSGAWQSKEMPHLKGNRMLDYNLLYTIFIEVANFKFQCEFLSEKKTGIMYWYIRPKTTKIKPDARLITDHFNLVNQLTTIGLAPLNQTESYIFTLMTQKNVCYSDNLTGSDFEVCLQSLKNI